jgi:hypothetical protein
MDEGFNIIPTECRAAVVIERVAAAADPKVTALGC